MKSSIICLLFTSILVVAVTSSAIGATVKITSVTFLPVDSVKPIDIYDAVKGTDSPTAINPPHWLASSRKTIPAVFVRNQEIRALVKIDATNVPAESIVISGHSSLINFDATEIIFLNGNKTEVILHSDRNLPDSVGKFQTEIKWEVETADTELSSQTELIETAVSDATFLLTLKTPIVREALFLELVDLACTEAAGLTDEKAICDALIAKLYKTGMHYGESGWSTFDILKDRGGMCGGWCRVFQDLCGTQGIKLESWFFTLRNHQNDKYEKKWMAIDIQNGGLNNNEPLFTEKVAFADKIYPMARYFSNESPDDDIDFHRERPLYRFSTVSDGHCVNFLNYNGAQYMYDPSFGKGSFGGFFSGSIPQNEDMNSKELKTFREVYFNNSVCNLQGRLLCIRKDDSLKKMIISPATIIVPDSDIQVYWENLDAPVAEDKPNETNEARQVSKFKKLFSVPIDGSNKEDEPINYLTSLEVIQEANLKQTKDNYLSSLLRRQAPFRLKANSQLPGILPPLETLQRALILRARELKDSSLNLEIDLLKSRSVGTFKRLIKDL